ncbi:MAG: glycerol-3-phosphate acyltransferase, partial [Candidatus Dadabacteria bacterium]
MGGALINSFFSRLPLPATFNRVCTPPFPKILVLPQLNFVTYSVINSLFQKEGVKTVVIKEEEDLQQLKELSEPKAGLVSLKNAKLLSLIFHSYSSIPIYTVTFIQSRGPLRHNPSYSLGLTDYLLLFLGAATKINFELIIFGQPLTINQKASAVRQVKIDMFRNLKTVRGTPFSSIETQVESILSGKEYEREIEILSQRLKLPKGKILSLAKKELLSMAANPKGWLYLPAAFISEFLKNRLFSQVSVAGVEQLRDEVRENTVLLLPLHKSHLDYVLLSKALYDSELNVPLVAAGANLNFWPLGFVFRSLGAYFIQRNARSNRIHSLVLKRYVAYLLNRGYLQEFYIEGGRTRTGRVRPPMIGLLKIIVESYLKGTRKDIAVVPVNISYERVVEDIEFAKENLGKPKTKESFLSLLKARTFLKRRYGTAFISFE